MRRSVVSWLCPGVGQGGHGFALRRENAKAALIGVEEFNAQLAAVEMIQRRRAHQTDSIGAVVVGAPLMLPPPVEMGGMSRPSSAGGASASTSASCSSPSRCQHNKPQYSQAGLLGHLNRDQSEDKS